MAMTYIIAIANQKGGVGKTTTAINLAASLAVAERKVLAIDMDPQGNLSSGLGFPKLNVDRHIYHALMGQHALHELQLDTELDFLKIVPAHTDLTGAEIELVDDMNRHRKLADAIQPVLHSFNYVIIDCPPSLGLLTLNALVAAQSILVPLQCEYYALEGLSHLLSTIEKVRSIYNPSLSLEGILLCMFDKRMNLTRQVANEVRQHFNGRVFSTIIPRNVRLGESPSFGKPVLLYDIDSAGSRSYLELAQEILEKDTVTTSTPPPSEPTRVNEPRVSAKGKAKAKAETKAGSTKNGSSRKKTRRQKKS